MGDKKIRRIREETANPVMESLLFDFLDHTLMLLCGLIIIDAN